MSSVDPDFLRKVNLAAGIRVSKGSKEPTDQDLLEIEIERSERKERRRKIKPGFKGGVKPAKKEIVQAPAVVTKKKTPEVDMSKVVLPKVEAFSPYRIRPLKDQIRQRFYRIETEALAESIKAVTQLNPVIVVRIDDDPDYDAQLIDGENRLKACKLLGWGISAYVREGDVNDIRALYEASVAANCNRRDHDAVERFAAIARMREEYGRSDVYISKVFGRSPAWVNQHYQLRKLHNKVIRWMIPVADPDKNAGSSKGGLRKVKAPLSFQLGLLLTQVKPAEAQIPLAKEIIGQKMSVAQAKHYIEASLRGVPGLRRASGHRAGEKMATLGSQARTMNYKLRIYTEMSDPDMQGLLGKLSQGQIQSMDDSLLHLGANILTLRQTIRRALPKGIKLGAIE